MAKTPEQSDYTSVQERILRPDDIVLRSFSDQSDEDRLPFGFKDYLELVDWAGRQINKKKRGYIPGSAYLLAFCRFIGNLQLNNFSSAVNKVSECCNAVTAIRRSAGSP